MSCEHTRFSLVLWKMQREKRQRLQTKEVVVNLYDYSRKTAGVNGLKDLLNEPLMPQDKSDDSDQSDSSGASWSNFTNLTDDVTACPMMTSLCVIELIMLGLV